MSSASSRVLRVVNGILYRAFNRNHSRSFVFLFGFLVCFYCGVVSLSFSQARLRLQVGGPYEASSLLYTRGLVIVFVFSQYHECGRCLIGLILRFVGTR